MMPFGKNARHRSSTISVNIPTEIHSERSKTLPRSISHDAINRVHIKETDGEKNPRPKTAMMVTDRRSVRQLLGHQDHVKKVAIIGQGHQLLYEFYQNRPLAAIIQDICDKWNIPSPDDASLQFSEPSRQTYITERNRADIQNGNVLNLTDSPAKASQKIIDKLKSGRMEEKLEVLKSLSIKSNDATFSSEFINKSGLQLLIELVISGNKAFSGDPLKYLLCSFVALMDHGTVSWDILENKFIEQVANCVSGARAAGDGCIRPALEILENVILQSSDESKLKTLEQFVTADKIIPYIQSKSADVQQSALALINAMFTKSSPDKRQKLLECFQSRAFRTVIVSGVLGSSHSVGPEMAHQLSILQKLMLNMYEERMKTKINANDATQMGNVTKNIEDLRRIAFDFSDFADPNGPPSRKSAVSKDFKKLGFTNQSNPALDFETVPPGLLALDNMIYFATQQKESYIKVVLENCGRANEQDCPFVEASIRLTRILCEFLQIGETPYEDDSLYYPMFFTVDKPLEEFFSCCIQLLNRTWKEMRASKEDFSKVISVVKEQISRALDRNQMPNSFDKFRTKLVTLAYPELKKVWEAERQKKDESKAQAKPILELRNMVMPEILDLIKKQRLMYLERGSRFPKYDGRQTRVKRSFVYWRLSPNYKAFHFGDCGESDELSIEQLPNKLAVLDIKELLEKNQCPHVKNLSKKTQPDLAFSIVMERTRPDEENNHNFIASSEQEFNMWVDGINALLNNKMTSKQTRDDMETLLNMEIKMRLLETEGIPIPNEPPPIPPLPDNFNFAYKTAVA